MADSTQPYHSARHDSDNVYHTDPDCDHANNILERCWCSARRPSKLCDLCNLNQQR